MGLVGFLFVLFLQVLVLAVVHNFTHRGIDGSRYLHKVESLLFGQADRLRGGHDAQLLGRGSIHDAYLGGSNAVINAGLIDVTSAAIVGAGVATAVITV